MARPLNARRPATLASLAAELGVSRTTVSNAYNRPDQLSPELRRRVLETARRLGYPGPDPVARSLRTRHAGAVGLLLTETLAYAFRDPAALRFLEGLAQACEEAGRGLLLVPAAAPSGIDGTAPSATVNSAAVDGFVVYSVPDDDPHLAAVLQRPVPAVVCDQPIITGVDRVGIDDRAAMLSIVRHVLRLGHRRIGVLCMRLGRDRPAGLVTMARSREPYSHVQRARLSGLRAGLAEADVDVPAVPMIECFEHSTTAGAAGAAALLERDPQLTAIVCTADVLAIGALSEADRRGLHVPEQLTITGFDGVPDAERVGLTTVRQPMLEKGRTAGRLLFDAGDGAPRTVLLDTELVVGRTCAPPRTAHVEWFSGL
ncbi:MAG TPA: LacI family DNA-binding transcriptional regulator [Pseudonocardiaceae bacterium]